jgi:protein-disulfide isomerase
MQLSRRSLLAVVAAASTAPGLAWAADEASRTSERAIGKADAKVTVQEYFSLTCTHCAHFSQTTMPDVKAKLIDPGKIRYVFRDFPLDQVALTAAMVARALPPERYEPFVSALFASQDRWAFARGVNSTDELWKMAALAGMSRQTFDSAINDTALKTFILQEQDTAQKKWKVDSTPTFIINGKTEAGALDFAAFEKLVSAAAA